MRRPSRDATITLGFVALSFALAFWQRPGDATSDTKVDLHVDPGAFLDRVLSAWNPSIDLGAVQTAQYSGFLWPMSAFFAALHELGISPWVVARIWLAVILALSAWGVLRLLDVLVGRPRGIAHVVAAAFYVLNPYTVVFTGRTTSALVGYAALPWLLLVVFHGVRAVRGWRGGWRGWWWAAAFALILTSLGGGINGAVVGWMLVGPLLLLLYEPAVGSVRWRDSASFLLRMGLLGTLASLWWIVPLVVHARYGVDFLQFTEQPGTIWATGNAAEALRLMGYWTSYVGVGFHGFNAPLFTESGTLLFNPLVVGASLLIPALAVAGFVWTRRLPYAPFLLLVLLAGAAIEVAGFPDGTPARSAMVWVYRNIPIVAFMRTTQKAAPLVAIGVAGLLGLGAHLAWARLRALPEGALRRAALVGAPAALAGLIVLAALPLVRGTAIEKQVTWDHIPQAWERTGHDLDRDLPRNTRAMVLPGQIFAYYDWGGTVDPILPRLTSRPVAVRYETPYSDPRSFDLLALVDRLVQQRRLYPGELRPLLALMGVGAVVTGTDDDIRRSGAVDPAAAVEALAGQGLDRPQHSYGPRRALPPERGDLGRAVVEPQVRRYDLPAGRGIVHIEPQDPATVIDGGADGIGALAAFGALPRRRPLLYAGDLSAAELRREAARGAEVVVTDSNRRRRFLPEWGQQNLGRTLTENETQDPNHASIDPFPDLGPDAQTVTVVQGASYLRTPAGGGLLEFPEHVPFAAFDGDPATSWTTDRYAFPADRWLEVGFDRPRDVPYVDLLPLRDWRGVEREVDINGVRAKLGPGVTRVPVRQRGVRALRITITRVDQPPGNLRGGGGFREIRIPGVHIRQALRPPILAGRALAGRDLRHNPLTYLFERTTADEPFRRDRYTDSPQIELERNRQDPERQFDRVLFAPAARAYAVDAWVQPDVTAPDSALDRAAGLRGTATFESSSRFEDQPTLRASSAFDGRPDTAWLGTWTRPSDPDPWISWRTERPLTVSQLRLQAPRGPVRRPTRVRVSWPGGTAPPLRVAGDGTVRLPRPARARAFRLTVLDARFPAGTTRRQRATRAVGIASLDVPGLPTVHPPAAGALHGACGDAAVEVSGRQVPLRLRGTAQDLLAGRPLRARGCGGPAAMGAGVQRVRSLPASFAVDLLRLRSPAPAGAVAAAPAGSARLLDPGRLEPSGVTGVRVAVDRPAWLVLGQSFSKGWEATCDGHALGEPRPVDGYANGWRAPAGCRDVAFHFTPQSAVRNARLISAIVCALLLAFLVGARLLRGPGPTLVAEPVAAAPDRPAGMPLARAALLAFAATVPLSLLFAARSSVLIFPALTLILWRGIGPRPLTAIAAGLLGIAVPLAYLIAQPENRGGYNFEYPSNVIWAHWLAVAALVLLMAACGRAVRDARAGRRPVEPPPHLDLAGEPLAAAETRDVAGAGRR
ncbi:MAG TPA: alpha-(1-_3)-arabinofuranosyltransferase family protein [Solirubrobacteraceae bacterium]|nr:alpha-(1->3)-arabinofuranosyltransferase family protein [Solirubrobacteraceae bacterium]